MMVVLAARVSGSGLNRVPRQEEKNDGFWGIGSRGRAKVRNEFQINSIHFVHTGVRYKDAPSGRASSGDEDGDRQLNYGLFRVAMC